MNKEEGRKKVEIITPKKSVLKKNGQRPYSSQYKSNSPIRNNRKRSNLLYVLIGIALLLVVGIVFNLLSGNTELQSKFIAHGPVFIKKMVIEKIGRSGDINAVETLIQCLNDKDPKIRSTAAKALGDLEAIQALPFLKELLYEEKEETVIESAFFACVKIAALSSSRYLNDEDYWEKEDQIELLVEDLHESGLREFGTPYVRALCEGLRDDNPRVRAISALLSKIVDKDSEMIDALIDAAGDTDILVRKYAFSALVECKGEQVKNLFIEALEDDDQKIRLYAIVGLYQYNDSGLFDVFFNALSDPMPEVRLYALKGLVKTGDERTIQVLKDMLHDESEEVRLGALRALAEMQNEEAMDILIEAMSNDDKNLRLYAMDVVSMTDSYRVVEALIRNLDDEDPDIRTAAINELIWCTDDFRVVDALIESVNDSDEDVRMTALTTLSMVRDSRVIDIMIDALSDDNLEIRTLTLNILSGIDDPRAEEAVREFISNDENLENLDRGFGYHAFDSSLERDIAETKFLDRTNKASAELYGEWIKDWILGGGSINCSWMYVDTIYVLSDGAVITPLYGASSVKVIAPKGVSFTIEDIGHSDIYYWDNNGNARTAGTGHRIGVSSEVISYLEGMNIPEVNEVIKGCNDDSR